MEQPLETSLRKDQRRSGTKVILAASLVAAVLGSIHAFSVFLEPLELRFDKPRSTVALTYSFGLVALTFAVLIGPRIYGRWSAAPFLICACVLAALGALIASIASSLAMLWLGYSVIFGAANGLGYGYGLQLSAQANRDREGWAMGIVTASYAFGAVISPILFDLLMNSGGFRTTMISLAIVLICIGLFSGKLLRTTGIKFQTETEHTTAPTGASHSIPLLWLGYFGGVLAGLMIIGHAAGIAASLHPGTATWIAPAVIAIFNLIGSLAGGRLADRMPLHWLLVALASITTLALVSLAIFGKIGGLMVGLSAVGFAYGGTIAAYPAAIAKLFGIKASARVYGRIFTAWGCAGLLGPWCAGLLFDWSGTYTLALWFASIAGLISVLSVSILFRRDKRRQ